MYYYISSDDDDKLPDLVLEPKSEPKEPNLQTTPDNLIVIDSDSSDCESPPAKNAISSLIIPESQIPAVLQVEPQTEVHIVPESPPLKAVKPDVPVQQKKVKFLLKEDDSTNSTESSPDILPDISPDTTPKVPPNSPASSNPDILLMQRLVNIKIQYSKYLI